MNTEELEVLIQGGRETPSLDFKGPCEWNVKTFVKDLLAMANVQDGGHIIVGVDDKTFERKGVSGPQQATFDIDKMKDQVSPYADPFVDFHVEQVNDSAGIAYVVITVLPFDEMPVICKRDFADVKAGRIYYRPNGGRPQSAAVATSHDMRTIVETSIARRMRTLRRIGLAPAIGKSVDDELDRELGDL